MRTIQHAPALDNSPFDDSLSSNVSDLTLTADPVRVARRHLWTALIAAFLGVLAAMAIRAELLTAPLDRMQATTFGALLSLHGGLMMYFVALPLFPVLLGQLLLPRLAGLDAEMPRVVRTAWHLLVVGLSITVLGFMLGGTEAGWKFDTGFGGRFNQPGTAALACGAFLAAVSYVLLSGNVLSACGAAMSEQSAARRSPLVMSGWFAGLLGALAGSILTLTTLMILIDATAGISILDRLHADPRVYLAVVKSFEGLAMCSILCASLGTALAVIRSRSRNESAARWTEPAFALLGGTALCAWVLDLTKPLATGWIAFQPSAFLHAPFFIAGCLIVIQALRYFRAGVPAMDTATLYASASIVVTMQALAAGLMMTSPVALQQLSETLFASGRHHLLMGGTVGLGFLAGLHEAWPLLAKRTYNDALGKGAAIIIIVGLELCFVPLMILGLSGASFRANAYPAEFQVLNVFSTAGSTILATGLLLAIVTLLRSRR